MNSVLNREAFKAQLLFCILSAIIFCNSNYCTLSALMRFVWLSQQTATASCTALTVWFLQSKGSVFTAR
jgi:hypothetical protein